MGICEIPQNLGNQESEFFRALNIIQLLFDAI